jgi:hypothetical protein
MNSQNGSVTRGSKNRKSHDKKIIMTFIFNKINQRVSKRLSCACFFSSFAFPYKS